MNIKHLGFKVASVASAGFAALALAVGAVDPTLVDVTTTFTGHVSTILTFVVAVIGGFIAAALIPLGLKKIYAYIRRLLGRA